MAAAQPGYEYAGYEYAYDTTTTAGYPQYAGYEANGTYAAGTAYEGYAASGAYHTAPTAGSSYNAVDPYAGYATTTYAYPAPGAPGGPQASAAPGTTATSATYPSQYSTPPSATGYAYDGRRPVSPASTSAGIHPNAHYTSYEYPGAPAGTYSMTTTPGTTYSPYKAQSAANGSAPSAYQTYPPGAAPAHATYGVPPTSHLQTGPAVAPPTASHMYGTPSVGGTLVQRRPEYYPSSTVQSTMHYVQHQPSTMSYRLPPRGGYQRELDEPGDENALLRHVVYITGLPKEIQNETLADIFGVACGPIAPVDVRSPKPKIWVYKDRQTREGKGEATVTFISPESAQTAINCFNGKELFGREIRVTLCPRRMYNMQKQNTPFNPGAAPSNTTTPISAITKPNNTNNLINTMNNSSNTSNTTITTTSAASASSSSSSSSSAAAATTATTTVAATTTTNTTSTTSGTSSTGTTATAGTTATTTTTSSSNSVTGASPIATISSSTLGLPRQLNHSLFKIRQTPEQQRGLLPTPPISLGGHMMGNAMHREGVRKELPRIALTRGNYANPTGVRPKPY